MNKSQKLYQISKDIEILENAGKIKAAEVLHQKFIKEAQYAMPQMMPMMMPQMMMPQMMPQMMPMMMARPTVAPAAVARPAVAPAAAARPVTTPAPVQQGQVTQPTPQPAPAPSPAPTPPPTNKEIKPPYTGTTPPPNPSDNNQRGYGDQQSKDQEMQYLMNEKKRLEEMGANDPSSPYYRQYQTILEMIKRNQGGSIIKKSKNMNKLQKLAQLNKDIELLEAAGKFKSAEVLQKKFVREAQAANMYNDPALNNDIKLNRYQGYTTPKAPATTGPASVPYSDPEAAVTNSQVAFQGLGTAMSQPQATSGDTANQMQAQNTLPGDVEPRLYQTSIQQIANLLNTKMPENRDKAQQIYDNTIIQFKDQKRKQAFAKQFQAIVSRNFPAGPIK